MILAIGRVVHRVSPKLSQKLQPLYPFSGQKAGQLAQLKTEHPKVALISSAGLYLQNQKPFDYQNFYGDATFRVFPSEFDLSSLRLTQSDFDRAGFDADPGGLFPLEELKEVLPEFGGRPAGHHFSLLGFNLKHQELLESTLPEILKVTREDQTDVVLLVPVCVVCHEVLPKVAGELESAGIATVTFAFIPKAVESARAPRTILFAGDCGLPFGKAAAEKRTELLRVALRAALEMKTPGEVWKFPEHSKAGAQTKNGTAVPVR